MARINKKMLDFAAKAKEVLAEDYSEDIFCNDDYVALRNGINEVDLTVFEFTNRVTFEDEFEEQQVVRIELEKSNRRYRTEREYNQLMEFLKTNHKDVLKDFESHNMNRIGDLM